MKRIISLELVIIFFTGCNEYKEEISKVESLTIERDNLVIASGRSSKQNTKYNFNIKENSDLAISMLIKK